jgi:micrococcal nuclease
MKNIVLNTKQIQETNFMEENVKYEPYVYKADIIKVTDGDTVVAICDLGMRVSVEITIRLAGINAPEMRGANRLKGIESRDFLRGLILMKSVVIKTYKDKTEKYGRWLADIYLDKVNVNQLMVEQGYAVKYDE